MQYILLTLYITLDYITVDVCYQIFVYYMRVLDGLNSLFDSAVLLGNDSDKYYCQSILNIYN